MFHQVQFFRRFSSSSIVEIACAASFPIGDIKVRNQRDSFATADGEKKLFGKMEDMCCAKNTTRRSDAEHREDKKRSAYDLVSNECSRNIPGIFVRLGKGSEAGDKRS